MADISLDGEGIGAAVKFEEDTFIIDYSDDADLAGDDPEGTTYPITLKAQLADQEVQTKFELTMKNPCLDPAYVTLEGGDDESGDSVSPAPDYSYVIGNDTDNSW